MKRIQSKLTTIENNYNALHSEISEIKSRLDTDEIKNVCDDLIKTVETTKDICD